MIRSDQSRAATLEGAIRIALLALVVWVLPAAPANAQVCPPELAAADLVDNDFGFSFCELCETGTVRIVVENPIQTSGPPGSEVELSQWVVTEDLGSSGLTYVPGTTTFQGVNVAAPPVAEPAVSGLTGQILTWTLPPGFTLEEQSGGPGSRERLIIEFDVRRHASVTQEGLVAADRTIQASVTVEPSCAPGTIHSQDDGAGTLDLREPVPDVRKQGRNVDAGQGGYSDTVYAHADDDVIWRIRVRNDGQADLQDFRFDDTMVPGNFVIHHVCDSGGDAVAAANGASPAACVPFPDVTSIDDFDVAAAFGGGANPYVVAGPGDTTFFYLVGRVTDSCTNRDNTVDDLEWGCQVEPPVGGIQTTSTGFSDTDTETLSTNAVPSGLDVDVDLTGVDTGQPMGARGFVTITLSNNSGGTIYGDTDGIELRNVLPPEYVVDTTWAPGVDATFGDGEPGLTLVMDPAYGSAYPGMVNRVAWTNSDPDPLANTSLDLVLTSSNAHPDFPAQRNMIRHGDEVTITIRTVLIDPQYYDITANVDVRIEEPGSDPPDTDPAESFPISDTVDVWFEEFCTGATHQITETENDAAEPEDLDVDIVGTELLFILTSTGDPLPLTVALTNNGGHDATDYEAYVTFGEAMVVTSVPPGCSPIAGAPLLPPWEDPAPWPGTASSYVCDRGTISPGEWELLNFEVVKNTALTFDDDLTFRADVIGEITLADGTLLTFPPPVARADGITDRANDYSLDAVRARVIGYDLFKDQVGTCTENNPPPGAPDDQVQIGEECTFHVESGGWFGFQTPGFTYIAVQDIQVVDENPDGQGFLRATDPLLTSTSAIQGVSLNPPPSPLDDAFFDWTFNTVVPAERITEKDHWFRADFSTRLLNDPVDTVAAPNEHAAASSNVLTSTFEAVFFNPLTSSEEIYGLGPNTVGYPREVHRRVDLTVTEPELTLVKEVCNETLYGAGPGCSNFVPLADDGDAYDTYIYRITVTNEAASGGAARAPAYDVTVTSVTDPSDMLYVDPLTGDVLDNDGDTDVDGGDVDGEGTVSDNVVENGTPAEVLASYTHSDALRRIDAGDSVQLYYRVDPDDDVAPLQQLVSSVTASYDSLEGPSGNQTAPVGASGEPGGARQYVSAAAEATIRIIPVEVSPKQVSRTALSAPPAPGQPQPVAIGEEVEFQLEAMIPVAQLRSFRVRDELPAGLSCSEAPAVDLDAPPYDAAGFVPGGVFTPTCTDDEVAWDFGNQTVTQAPGGAARFDFDLFFVARVDNVAGNQDATLIRNGGSATVTEVRYVDEGGNTVVLSIDEAQLVVQEPLIELTKAFSVAQVDAADVPRVTVTATNNGTATAYDLRVLEDLTAADLTYVGNVAGADPPDVDVATFGPDRPLFSWDPDVPLAPGESLSFSFEVRVGDTVEPHQVLANTVQADWASLPDAGTALNSGGTIGPDGSPTGRRIGALPNAGDALNDYEAEAVETVDVPPLVLDKTDLDPAQPPKIGTHKPFRVVVALPEGRTRDVVVADALDTGGVSYGLADNVDFDVTYTFQGITTINGQPPGEAALVGVPADGATGTAVWTIGEVVTATEDDLGGAPAVTPEIRIEYHARIQNDLVTDAGDTLQNTAQLDYTNGDSGATEALTDATAAVVAVEPQLSATKSLANVTAGKAAGDPPAFDDVLEYVVTVVNNGTAMAHDVNIVDTLPPEVTLEGTFVPVAEINTMPVGSFVATPAGAPSGPLVWGSGNGDGSLDVPAGGFLDLTYRVRVTTPLPDPDVIENSVWVDWTSLDAPSPYERTGAGCPTVTPPDDYCFGPAVATGTADPVAAPDPVLKENTQSVASVGEVFTYRITVPATPYAFPIHDVQIHDDLTASAADLELVGVTRVAGSGAWTPTNTGTATNLVIQDTTDGIDIPAGEQVVVDVSVVLLDTPANTTGLAFTNTASYLYNWVDDEPASQRPGMAGTTPPMTIVGPDALTLDKSGPAQMTIGTAETFTLDVQNTGTGPAFGWTATDDLPDTSTGGTCDTPPTAFTARVYESDGTTPVSPDLAPGTDFEAVFAPAPACQLTFTGLSPAAAIGATQRLIVTYAAELDSDTDDAVALTNVAGATRWYSAEGPNRREYTRTVTDGTPGTVDHEDAWTTTTALPRLRFEKTVVNVTTGEDPAQTARPGETLRYRLEVENLSPVAVGSFSLVDELDALNTPALFEPGTLQVQLVTVPPGADASSSSDTGGAAGTGLVDVRNLALPAQNDTVVVEFEATLASVLPAGTYATNQSELRIGGVTFAGSDDPGVNGAADPLVPGDEDPTRVLIDSAPDFEIWKTSADLSGDPAVLLAGETLRYTITVKNVGTDDASDATLRDQIPVNTTYVPGSTTLNGAAVPDGPGGVAPLSAGILVHAPEDPTPGAMRADPDPAADNVATLVFDVVVDPAVPDGTVIANQALVSAVAGGVVDQPSDDPDTAAPDDPTRDVVGNLPLLFAAKDVALLTDNGTAGVVDPTDVLRYTITIRNDGAIPATNVSLADAVPANTAYVDDSVTLNGLPVGQPDGGVSPLIAGIPVSSSDLTPPLPGAGAGTLSPGEVAIVEFDLQVDAGVPAGTIISNQARVTSAQLPNLLTDGDGDPATGPEPTVVVVGDGQQLAITKSVAVVGGGAALPGAQLEYVVRATNIATVPADGVVITDDLDLPVAGQLSLVPGSATLDGAAAGVTVAGSLITADYAGTYGALAPGASVVLRFVATIDPGLAIGTTITNTGNVTWNVPPQTASASVSIDVGGMPGVGVLSGSLWHDADFDEVLGGGERALAGWIVQLTRNGQVVHTTQSDGAGAWRIPGLEPNDLSGDQYAVRFRAPGASATTAALGRAVSPFTNGLQEITDILVTSGSNLLGLDLPIQPNGVVYDSVQRIPVDGASVSLLNSASGTPLPAACFDDPAQQGQVTLADGFYKFDLNFSDAACPSPGSYVIDVSGSGAGYGDGLSAIIPPATDGSTTPFSVPSCPASIDDAVPATGQFCEVQPAAVLPPASVPARAPGTRFHAHLVFDASQTPGSSQIFNNHLALDPSADTAVSVTKTTPSVNVVLGQLVPYEITIRNQVGVDLLDLGVVDRYPAGFRYVEGSARIDGMAVEPVANGRQLVWGDLDVAASESRTLQLLLAVGAGVGEGEYVNRAQAVSDTGSVPLSGEAQATVRVVPDPDFACTDVIGKVYDDADRDGAQDGGEQGLEGVRLVTPRGLVATTDRHGRFHITCAIVPHPDRGSNMVLKLDDRSLPSGYRLSTRQVQVKRATRGKAVRFAFGASLHRVVGLDLADAVFEPGTPEIRPQWRERVPVVVEALAEGPSTLRLVYVADVEEEALVERRLAAVERAVLTAWEADAPYPLTVESEVFWRRGAPPGGPMTSRVDVGRWPAEVAGTLGASPVARADQRRSGERHLPHDAEMTEWSQDPELLAEQRADRLEERAVRREKKHTVKLRDVVPAIRFESGDAELPRPTIERLRTIVGAMQHLENVRIHLIGHADDRPLAGELARRYRDNEGLSRERAGEVAEILQDVLDLAPDAISYEWAGAAQPLASNATEAGRASNRRVELEIWYDETEEQVAVEEFVVAEDFKRLKVCRLETVCKMRFRDGHERRARVKNLVAPLRIDGENVRVPDAFVARVRQALQDLRDERNVTVRFVGHTDDASLSGRTERIYGTHLALSKAMARRVALAVQDALVLPTSAVASDGRGASRPVASNATGRGRDLNRRVEVEFWYDDPLQELPDEPQICPDAVDESMVTRVYDPPWGGLPELPIVEGDPVLPADFAETLERALSEVADRQNVRVRFVGYTRNERLARRTALVYGDDIGLSAARARRTKELVQERLGLTDEQVEHEGRGFLHSNDVVNGGFIQGETSHVAVEVVYDEPALLDDYDGVEITKITREVRPQDPLALNLMRVTVDGRPVDDPGRSSADIQRCTDVALGAADVELQFDASDTDPRLSVTSDARAVAVPVPGGEAEAEVSAPKAVRFRMYTNYAHFIERAEVRVFERGQSLRDEPLTVVPIGEGGTAAWRPEPAHFAGPVRELAFVVRAYDAEGRFDETAPQSLWMVRGEAGRAAVPPAAAAGATAATGQASGVAEETTGAGPAADTALLAGYGEDEPALRNIDLGRVGTVRVKGSGVPPGHTIWLAGEPVPVDESGAFVAEAVLPAGLHTVEVAVLDEEGNGELFLRDLELKKSDWFYVGLADVTFAGNITDGPADALQGQNATVDPDSFADGRFAFFVDGRFGDDWKLTASADTREGPLEDIFSNFLDKSPDALFRRMDPDYFQPTFGDDGTVEQTAPTMGKFYAKLRRDDDHLMWGNFEVGYRDNELALVERGLYGGNVHFETDAATSFGERRVRVDGFAADPGTVPSREEFRGTGGSLYFLRHRDILMGSDRLRIELRDKQTGLVVGVVPLSPDLDYDFDYIQGRVLLSEPITSTVDDELLVRTTGLDGNEAWLVVQYEYAPGFEELDTLAVGGQGHWWLTDFLKVGATAYRNDEASTDSGLYAASLVARHTASSWLKVQAGWSSGLVTDSFRSDDGGFEFSDVSAPVAANTGALGYRADASVGFGDWIDDLEGRMSLYYQRLEAGYSAPGLSAPTETEQFGGTLDVPVTDAVSVRAQADAVVQEQGLTTHAAEVDVEYRVTDHWRLQAGVRNDEREDDAPVVPASQEEGGRTDAVVQTRFDSLGDWSAYAFAQASVRRTGTRRDNHRGGVGAEWRVNDRLAVEGEASYGSEGPAVRIGTDYQQTAATSRYLDYSLDDERGLDGAHRRQGRLISGVRTRIGDSASVFQEDRFQHAGGEHGLSRAMGMDWSPGERWTLSASWETGTLFDRRTLAETERNAGGGRVSYRWDALQVSSGIEYRSDETEQPDGSRPERTTWLFRNDLRLQLDPSWRLLGKLNHSFSDSSLGEFYDGGYTEAVLGFAFRPVHHDRLNMLAKYTYFYNMPATDQLTPQGTAAQFLQKSHVGSLDVTYDLTDRWTLGGKYAYRRSEVSLDRENPDFFDNDAHLFILRADWRFLKDWETSIEGRTLYMPQLDEQRSGAVFTLYRYLGEHFKIGVGYNFTGYSADLTDLGFDRHGVFVNLIGTL